MSATSSPAATGDAPLEHLVYVSSAVHPCDASALEAILDSAVRHNQENGVTGMLLYKDGNFLQVLEGLPPAVTETFGRVAADPRHRDVTVIQREPVARREFGDWHMGFRLLADRDAPANPAFAPLVFGGFDARRLGAQPGLALELLLDFARRR